MEKIGASIFSNCNSLSTVTVDKNNQFYTSEGNCILAKNDDATVLYGYGSNCIIPPRAKKINTDAFSGNTALNSIIIPENVQVIGGYAFSRCTNLKSIILNEGLLRIGDENLGFDHDLFSGCSNLTALHLPSTVEYIAGDFCSRADNLKSLTIDKNNKVFKSDGNCIIRKDNIELVAGCATSVIPNYVKTIGIGAFSGCKMKTIELPKNLTVIGVAAFSCSTIETIELPKSLTSIENSAFSRCLSLQTVNLPNGLLKIGSTAFSGCTSIENVAIPNSVTEIGSSVFFACRLGMTVTLPHTVTTIGSQAFDLATVYTNAEGSLSSWFTSQHTDINIGYDLPWRGSSMVIYGCTFEYTNGIPYVSSVVKSDSPYSSAVVIPYRDDYDLKGWATDKDTRQIVAEKIFTVIYVLPGNDKADVWVTFDNSDENYNNIPSKTVLYAVRTQKTD